ncbi:GrpB family protein [Kribbella sp. NPDC051952]|uniref:GrpB family protein n=1 Tax=Kribbella sp. NPDC051952 TaxID=3154851 RepID=UPI0034395462
MVLLAEYDESWPGQFATTAAELRVVFGDTVTEIEHIGSTSVPGLVAKPVIDIAARAVTLEGVAGKDAGLRELGFEFAPDGPPGRRTYTRAGCNLHVFPFEVWDELNQRILRDHLRETPDAVRRYGDLKRKLAVDGLSGFDYTAAKTDLIQELTDTARAHRGLPSVRVWED